MSIDLDSILRTINPPDRIESMEQLRELVMNPHRHTIIERKFYQDLVGLLANIKHDHVAGDMLAVGIWKGGSALFLHALNHHFGLKRKLWLSDTFFGFVGESIRHEKDQQALQMFRDELRFELTDTSQFPTPGDVEDLFRSCNLWDELVTILAGPLESTLPPLHLSSLALIHIDVDFYEPTHAALALSYPALQPGGYVIIDDYGVDIFNCKDAVDDYRAAHGIAEPMSYLTDYAVCWRKTANV